MQGHNLSEPEQAAEDSGQFDLRHTSLWQEGDEASAFPLQAVEKAHLENFLASPAPTARAGQQGPASSSAAHYAPHAQRSAPPETPNIWHELMDEDERDAWANHADPLVARIATAKTLPAQEGKHSSLDGKKRQKASSSPTWLLPTLPPHIRLGLITLAILGILALVLNGGLLFTGVIHKHTQQPTSLSTQQSATHCEVTASTGALSFNIAPSQHRSSKQHLEISSSAQCPASLNWQVSSSEQWLNVTPSSGQLQSATQTMLTVRVNAVGLQPAIYSGFLVFSTQQGTQTIKVQLAVLSTSSSPTPSTSSSPTPIGQPPATASPGTGTSTVSISITALDFNAIQGQANPSGQAIKIANISTSSLNWHANFDASTATWLHITPGNGTLTSGQSQQMTVNVSTAALIPGSYSTNVSITATDPTSSQVQGSPASLSVTLTIMQPCTLQVTPTSLSFTGSTLGSNPSPQTITLSEVGNCALPISWTASTSGGSKWLVLSVTSGSDSGTGSTISVQVHSGGMLPGQYNAQIMLSATDSLGATIQNSPQTIQVTLTMNL